MSMDGVVALPPGTCVAYLLDADDRTAAGPVPMMPGRALTLMARTPGMYRLAVYAPTGRVWSGVLLHLAAHEGVSLQAFALRERAA